MNRNSSKHSFIGRNLHTKAIYNAPVAGLSSHRRIMSFTTTEDFSNNLDLFSRNRRTLPVLSSDESDWQVRLDGSTKPASSILGDLLLSNEEGKHDYDWLLTPPETQPKSVAPKRNSLIRSGSTNRTSKLSESNNHLRQARSSSVTRLSICATQNINGNSNILNNSSASVSSYVRPTTPTNRSPSAARPSTASSRTTPSRSRPSSTTITTTTPINRTIRPSTRSPHPQSPTVQPASRPSTPIHRNPTSFKNRNVGPTSRSNSPVVQAPPQLISHPDFPNETPPNLRTSVPEGPVSAGRSRLCAAMIVKGNVENTNTRRQSSHIVSRGRLAEPLGRGRSHANVHVVESVTTNPIKVLNSENGTGFGRSISKKSFDVAIKHMDIRNSGTLPLFGSTRFPQSIRPSHGSSANNNLNSNDGNFKNSYSVKPVSIEHKSPYLSKLTCVDANESLRYDSILLEEDLKNTSWLHSADKKNDQSPLFDNGFESLSEPFAPL